MPSDALASVLRMLIAGRFRYAVLQGERLRYGQGQVRFYRLESTIDADELSTEE